MTTTNKASVLLVLLLALPACGQNVHPPLLEWVTVRVDSLNLGQGDTLGCSSRSTTCGLPGCLVMHYEAFHEWVISPESFVTEAALPTPEPRESWTERQRERICRVCLRHEWQAQPEPVESEFDSLRARLVLSP